MGAHDYMNTDYDWLIVSTNNLWIEIPYKSWIRDKMTIQQYNKYKKEFNNPFNWDSPSESIKPILKKYNFKDINLNINKGKGLEIQLNKKDANKIKTIQGFPATIEKKIKIKIDFNLNNIAVIKGLTHYEDEIKDNGIYFAIPNPIHLSEGIRDVGFDTEEIDAIIILKNK